ncbi:MAG: SUMF1/EgtB/PvdO family nonheme iron enzyme, partial [Blastocatellia bacterium]
MPTEITPPSPELYVFLSFAGEDRHIAEQVLSFLTEAGVRVFYDRNMRSGVNWDMTIEQALKDCDRMVLLLSSSSMPEKPEVYREWFYFARKNKPIHSLLIESVEGWELHSRFESGNYIPAHDDLEPALKHLLADLKNLPPPEIADPVTQYRHERIAEWSLPRYELDNRFVNLTLTMDRPEDKQQRWHPVNDPPMRDLREVLAKAKDNQALVLIGAPGSGKSTLLRRLQLDHSQDRLEVGFGDESQQVSFFVALNEHKGHEAPSEWLAKIWQDRYPLMPKLDKLLKSGRMLLLLDALNEMQPRKGSYAELIVEWKTFVQQSVREGNRLVFSCRSRDIGAAQLGSKELPVPLIDVQPMTGDQMQDFLQAYSPEHHERIWKELKGSKQFDLFQTPYFLKLLCEQVGASGNLPKGRAGLFTGFVRRVLDREKDGELFQAGVLLSARDRQKMASGKDWRDEFDLPANGKLIPKLSQLAFDMQKDGSEVSLDYDEACRMLDDQQAEQILKAGVELNLLDEARDSIKFFHQSLQEYFAARLLAKEPSAALVRVEWAADKVPEPLAETIAGLSDGEPLPPLEQTGWEETTLTASAMAKDQAGFVRSLVPENLALAARCAASAEVKISEELKQEIRWALVDRTKDMKADLRARIAAGESLGLIGDPRFELRSGEFGKYLFPPLVAIPGSKYTIGDNKSDYDFEKPAGEVQLDDFQIGQFPVTNAEYKLFMDAGGYEDERWWDTPESLAWLSGEATSEGRRQSWRDDRKLLQDNWTENEIRAQANWDTETKELYLEVRSETDEEFEERIAEWFPEGQVYRQPEFWDDARFNNPAQPVVGVTWFEARAYCNWLTADAADGLIYRLPTEAEFEAAARGKKGRQFPYGSKFDSTRCNTFESHIRRTTPIGVFDNATPEGKDEGAFDLSGNAYTWTLSVYDQEKFPYPYRSDDGREELAATGVRRVLRGGSW